MKDRDIYQSNLFAFILLFLYAFSPILLKPIFQALKMPISLYLVLPQLLLLIVPTIIYFIITKKSIKETLRLNRLSFKSILIIVGIGILAQPVAMFLSFLTQFIFPNRISQVVSAMNDIPLLIRVAVIALTPAICEEITMRGVVLSGYNQVSISKSAIITGLFFGMLHLDGNQLLYAFAIGIIFAYLVRITNSIYASMICHFTINGTQVLISALGTKMAEASGQDLELVQKAGLSSLTTVQLVNTLFIFLAIAIACIGIIIMLMQKLARINNYSWKRETLSVEKIKILNWPVVVSILIYISVIASDIKEILNK